MCVIPSQFHSMISSLPREENVLVAVHCLKLSGFLWEQPLLLQLMQAQEALPAHGALQVSLLTARCSWWAIPPVPLDSSTTVGYTVDGQGQTRGGERVTRNSPKKNFFRGLYYQQKGKGLEGLWECVGQNLIGNTANCLCFRHNLLKFWWLRKESSYNLATVSFCSFTLWNRNIHFNILNTVQDLRPKELQIQCWQET